MEWAHRTRKSSGDRPRPITAKLLRFKKKEIILYRSNMIKISNVYINEDFPDTLKRKRKDMMPPLRAARGRGDFTYLTNWLSDNTLIHRKNHEVAIHHGVCWTSTHQHSIHPYLTDYSPKGLDTLDHLELNTAQYTSYKSHDFGNDNEPENNFLLPINNDSQYYPFEQLNSTLATKYQLLTLTISRSLYANFHKIKDYLLGMSQ